MCVCVCEHYLPVQRTGSIGSNRRELKNDYEDGNGMLPDRYHKEGKERGVFKKIRTPDNREREVRVGGGFEKGRDGMELVAFHLHLQGTARKLGLVQ